MDENKQVTSVSPIWSFFFFFLKTLFEGLIIKNGLQILVSRSQSHKLLVYPSFFYKKYSHFVK